MKKFLSGSMRFILFFVSIVAMPSGIELMNTNNSEIFGLAFFTSGALFFVAFCIMQTIIDVGEKVCASQTKVRE